MLTAGADVSITARMTRNIRHAIATIPETSWEAIEYTDALFDEDTQRWISSAEVAEVLFVAFASKNTADQVPGRLVVRRIPELNPTKDTDQPGLFDLYRFHAVFTPTPLLPAAGSATPSRFARSPPSSPPAESLWPLPGLLL